MSEAAKELPEDLKESIEDIRLANHAIRACVRLLAEDSMNNGCQADGPVPFIKFQAPSSIICTPTLYKRVIRKSM